MLSNERLTGRFEFGRKRNQFSTKLDYVKQIHQPDEDVERWHDEGLRIRSAMTEMVVVLESAASGELGDDSVYEALSVFRLLTGERVWVTVEPRLGRKQTVVRGHFRPHLIAAASERVGAASNEPPGESISLWLREPPRLDAIAERVHQLIDVEGFSHRAAAKQLRAEGHDVNSGNVWYSHRRWYEMNHLPVSNIPYNNGQRRDSV